MPIGFDGNLGGRAGGLLPGPPSTRRPVPEPGPAPPPITLSPGQPSTRVDTTPDLEVTVWTAWRTSGDERVCPVCGPLHGQEWPDGAGPMPPAHPNCRCRREVSRVEWRVRG